MARIWEDGSPSLGFQRAAIVQLCLKVIAGNTHVPGAVLPSHTVNSLL